MQNPFTPKPGDRVVRRPRESEMAPVHARVERREVSVRGPTSPMMLVYSFFAVALVGAILLSLPVANSSGEFMSPIGTFFTSVSAMTGTGLIIVDTREHWTAFGETVLAALIFIGGLGFMTGAAFLLLITGRRSSLQGRLVVGAGLDDNRLGTIASLARNIIMMAIIVQIIGAILIFVHWYVVTPMWDGMTLGEGLWQSVFTSISAFNNAGFEILPDEYVGGTSLTGLSNDIPSLTIIGVMILIGATSYATLANVIDVRGLRGWRSSRDRPSRSSKQRFVSGMAVLLPIGILIVVASMYVDQNLLRIVGITLITAVLFCTALAYLVRIKSWRQLTLDSKLVLVGTGIMLLIGLIAFMTFEWDNSKTIGDEPVERKISQAFFHTVNRTAGFSTIDYSSLRSANLSVTEGMMFVGGASASVASGIKVNTFMVIVVSAYAIFSGRERTRVFGREIPRVNVHRAMAVGATATGALSIAIITLFAVQPDMDFRTGVFEIISAFGTVGWSAGATQHLNDAAKIVVSITMFAGRFGPITLALFMAGREQQETIRYATERVRIG